MKHIHLMPILVSRLVENVLSLKNRYLKLLRSVKRADHAVPPALPAVAEEVGRPQVIPKLGLAAKVPDKDQYAAMIKGDWSRIGPFQFRQILTGGENKWVSTKTKGAGSFPGDSCQQRTGRKNRLPTHSATGISVAPQGENRSGGGGCRIHRPALRAVIRSTFVLTAWIVAAVLKPFLQQQSAIVSGQVLPCNTIMLTFDSTKTTTPAIT